MSRLSYFMLLTVYVKGTTQGNTILQFKILILLFICPMYLCKERISSDLFQDNV